VAGYITTLTFIFINLPPAIIMSRKQRRERCLKKSFEDAATNCKTINAVFRR